MASATTTTSGGAGIGVSAASVTANAVSVAETHADADDGDYEADGATVVALADGATAVDGTGAGGQRTGVPHAGLRDDDHAPTRGAHPPAQVEVVPQRQLGVETA